VPTITAPHETIRVAAALPADTVLLARVAAVCVVGVVVNLLWIVAR
jgi:hypothetical protein